MSPFPARNNGKSFHIVAAQKTTPHQLAVAFSALNGDSAGSVRYHQVSRYDLITRLSKEGMHELAAKDYVSMCSLLHRGVVVPNAHNSVAIYSPTDVVHLH